MLLHGFNAVIGQAVFPHNTAMSGLHHFCDDRDCGSAYLRRSDGNVSAFAFKHGNDVTPQVRADANSSLPAAAVLT